MSLHQTLRVSNEKLTALKELVPLEKHKERIKELDMMMELGNVWADNKKGGELAKERSKLSSIVDKLQLWQDGVDEDLEYCTLFQEEAEKELTANATMRLQEIERFELQCMFRDPMDGNAAILSINAGAGGREAQDWVAMLLRMYLRYCEANGLTTEMLDQQDADGGCIDSATILITGTYAFGWLRPENGIHRMVRNSPFDAKGSRHTSFAAVRVLPDVDDTIDIKIEDKDLETYGTFAGGKGGQSVNRTKSACVIKHLPTGISFTVRNERSWHENLRIGMKMLKAKLYDIEVQKKNAVKDKLNSELADIAFGSQIRSYVFSPSAIVKDHRTKYEETNAVRVLDGNIQGFLEAFIRSTASA